MNYEHVNIRNKIFCCNLILLESNRHRNLLSNVLHRCSILQRNIKLQLSCLEIEAKTPFNQEVQLYEEYNCTEYILRGANLLT